MEECKEKNPEEFATSVAVDAETRSMLRNLCKEDERSASGEVRFLIRKEIRARAAADATFEQATRDAAEQAKNGGE